MRSIRLLVPAVVLSLIAAAQAQPGAPVAKRLPPVVVTAEREAPVLDAQAAPAAVTQIGGEQIGAAGLDSLYDLPAAVPNLTLSRSTSPAFGDIYAVRGIANTEFFSDPALVLYVDDAPMGDTMSNPVDLLDLAGADIWRGPQGSRFGKNSAAGVIDLTTRKPTDTWETAGRASYASRNTALYRASVMGPLSPGQLRLGLSGSFGSSDGFLDNPLLGHNADESESAAGRLYLGWTPGSDWDISLTATADRFEGGAALVPVTGPMDKVSSDVDQKAEAGANGQVLRLRKVLPGAIVTSITAHRDYSLDPLLLDIDLSPIPGNTALIKQDETIWSEELRLQSPDETATWLWRGGLFASSTSRDGDDTRSFIAPVAPGVYLPMSQQTVFALDDEDYALFGQATYAGIDRLGITLGGRLDYAVRGIERTKSGTPPLPIPGLDDEDSFLNAAPQLTVDYRLDEGLLAYASSGLGFKPGGFSAYIDPPKSPAFDTEKNWASEAGLKSEWLERKLQANVSVFYNDISDYQVEHNLLGGTDRTVINAASVTAQGVEVELVGRLLKGLELSASAGYTDIQFDDFSDPDTGVSLDGKRPPYVPEFDARLAAQYRADCGGFVRVEYEVLGETFFDEANSDAMTESGFGLLNARVGYEKSDLTVCLFGSNLTDEEYFSRRLMLAEAAGVPGAPLTVGVSAGVKF